MSETRTLKNEIRKLVLKKYEGFDWKDETNNANKEFEILQFLQHHGFKVPKTYFLNSTLDILSTSYFLMDFIEGNSNVDLNSNAECVAEMAHFLASLHKLNAENINHLQIPKLESPIQGCLAYLPKIKEIEHRDELIKKIASYRLNNTNPPALKHGDFWPNNVIWKDKKIAAVIDWEDISLGDPMADFATARIELFCMFGKEVTALFSTEYIKESKLDTRNLPIWEIYASASALATMDSWGLEEEEKIKRSKATTTYLMQTINNFNSTLI